ncbi:hypothetical protein PG989_007710 [Apiospora arundinis]
MISTPTDGALVGDLQKRRISLASRYAVGPHEGHASIVLAHVGEEQVVDIIVRSGGSELTYDV